MNYQFGSRKFKKRYLILLLLCGISISISISISTNYALAAQQPLNAVPKSTASNAITVIRDGVNTELAKQHTMNTELYAADLLKANISCFASEAAFNTCFTLDWSAGGVSSWADVQALISGTGDYIKYDGTRGNPTASVDLSTYLSKTNTTEFTPTADYHPATKKYVDDSITAGGGYTDEQAQDATGGMFSGNTETGITATYNDATGKVDFVVATQSDVNFTSTLNTKLAGIAAGAEVNVNADWNSTSGDSQILNKPTENPISASTVTGLFTGTGDCLGSNGEKVDCGGGGGAVSDTAYGASWDGVADTPPSKNAMYDKIEALALGGVTVQSADPTSASASGWYAATGSGDIFYKSSAGLFTIAGSYTADPATPTLTSRVIGTNGTTLTLTGSASLSVGAGGSGGFDVDCATTGTGITATYTSGAPGTNLVYTLGTTVNSSDTCDLDYTQPGNGIEATTGGADLASITSGAITNNSTQSASTEYTVYITDNTTDFNGITSTVTKYTGTEDTIISQGPHAVYNFGGQTASEVHHYAAGDQKNLLLRFPGLSNIPTGATVTSVEIGLYKSGGTASTDTFTAYRNLRTWVEGTLTGGGWASDDNPDSACWDYYGGSVAWGTAGGMGSGTDIAVSSSGSMSVSAALGSWGTMSGPALAADVQGIISGTYANNGWNLLAAGMDKYHVIQTSEGVNGQRPYLKVVYTY